MKKIILSILLLIPSIVLAWTNDSGWYADILTIPRGTSLPSQCGEGQVFLKTDASSGQQIYACVSGSWVQQGGGGGGTPGGSDTQVQFNNAGAFGGDSGFVYSSGNVGIGTETVSAKLTVDGDMTFTGSSRTITGAGAIGLNLVNSGPNVVANFTRSDGRGHISMGNADQYSLIDNYGPLVIRTNNTATEALYIDDAGNVGVGGTNARAGTPTMSVLASGLTGFGDTAANATIEAVKVGSNPLLMLSSSASADGDYVIVTSVGNVGIGTLTPAVRASIYAASGNAQLDMQAAGTTAVSRIRQIADDGTVLNIIETANSSAANSNLLTIPYSGITRSGGTGGFNFLATNASGVLRFGTAGSAFTNERMRIDSAGNIGIGTIAPVIKLELQSTGGEIFRQKATTSSNHVFNTVGDGTNILYSGVESDAGGSLFTGGLSNASALGTGNATALQLATNNSVRMTVSSDGNVGIGSTAPGAKLEVKGSGTGRMVLGEYGGSSNYAAIGLAGSLTTGGYNFTSSPGDTNLFINRPTGKSIYFRENGTTDYFTLGPSGKAAFNDSTPDATLEVVKVAGTGLFMVSSTAAGDGDYFTVNSLGNVGIGLTNPNFLLNVNGNVGIGTTAVNSTPYAININNVATFNSEFTYASNIGVGTTTINWNNGSYQNIGIGTSQGAYVAFTHPTNGSASKLTLRIKQDATGNRVVSFWPSTVLWPGNSAPTLTTTANKSDLITCIWNGTNDYCASTLNF